MDLVGPAGVIAERLDGARDVDVARFEDRLAVVERLEQGELVDVGFDGIGQPPEEAAALAGGGAGPDAVEGGPGGLHRPVDVRRARRGGLAGGAAGAGALGRAGAGATAGALPPAAAEAASRRVSSVPGFSGTKVRPPSESVQEPPIQSLG